MYILQYPLPLNLVLNNFFSPSQLPPSECSEIQRAGIFVGAVGPLGLSALSCPRAKALVCRLLDLGRAQLPKEKLYETNITAQSKAAVVEERKNICKAFIYLFIHSFVYFIYFELLLLSCWRSTWFLSKDTTRDSGLKVFF